MLFSHKLYEKITEKVISAPKHTEIQRTTEHKIAISIERGMAKYVSTWKPRSLLGHLRPEVHIQCAFKWKPNFFELCVYSPQYPTPPCYILPDTHRSRTFHNQLQVSECMSVWYKLYRTHAHSGTLESISM